MRRCRCRAGPATVPRSTSASSLFTLSTPATSAPLEAIATSRPHEGYAITLLPVAVPTQDEVRGAFSRLGELAVDGVIVIMEVHLLDAATVTLPPTSRSSWSTPTPATAIRSSTPTRPTAPGTPSGTCSTSATARSGTGRPGGVVRGAAPRRRLAGRAAEAAGCPAPPVERGDWSAESGYRAGLRWSPGDRTAPPSSRPTTRWRSACCGRCTRRAARCPATSAWSASTTSPRRRPSCRR